MGARQDTIKRFVWSPVAVSIFVAVGISTGFVSTQSAAGAVSEFKKPQSKKTSVSKEVQGEVTWIKNDRIAVLFASTPAGDSEMLLPFDENVQIVHKKSPRDIGIGDTVSVAYEETSEETDEGVKTKRKAKIITWLRQASQKPTPYGIDANDTGVLVSDVVE